MLDTLKNVSAISLLLVIVGVLGWCKLTDTPEAWVKKRGGDVNKINAGVNGADYTLMHRAAIEGRVDVLTWLKERGADVNVKDGMGWTPMHWAAFFGKVDVMEWLRAQGAVVNVKDKDGVTPMSLARQRGHVEVVKWVKETAARPTDQGLADWAKGTRVVYKEGMIYHDYWDVEASQVSDLNVESVSIGTNDLYEITYNFKALAEGKGVYIRVLVRYYEEENNKLKFHDLTVLDHKTIR
ncbi:MAG: ankyrin repeat domain-containing protein [Phycisphaerales bacterium]|nr:ankyrin repeat domain-containing protein [Phycisphaerales bacterium]